MWERENLTKGKESRLTRTFVFKNFTEAFAFMTKVAAISEKNKHHPYWINSWNSVTISLSTHDAGNIITEKDVKMADEIDMIYAS